MKGKGINYPRITGSRVVGSGSMQGSSGRGKLPRFISVIAGERHHNSQFTIHNSQQETSACISIHIFIFIFIFYL